MDTDITLHEDSEEIHENNKFVGLPLSTFTQNAGKVMSKNAGKHVQMVLERSIGNNSVFRQKAVKANSNKNQLSLLNSPLNYSENFDLNATKQLIEPQTPTLYKHSIFNSINCLPEKDTGRFATTNLYTDFNLCLISNNTSENYLELISGYEEHCDQQEKFLKEVKLKTGSDIQYESIDNMCGLLRQEMRTWRLLFCLIQDKIQDNVVNNSSSVIHESTEIIKEDEQKLVEKLFRENKELRKAQNVIDWLEKNAASEINNSQTRIKCFHDNVSWENTIHYLKQKFIKGQMQDDKLIISEVDPDAPGRQKRAVNDLDKNDEIMLLKHVFACIRAGELKEAQELCISCGQSWRAASLEGWKLYSDPNSNNLLNASPMVGNPIRDLWKYTAWQMSTDETLNIHERAIYGTFCGNLKSTLNVCMNWEDYLWAYFRVMVDITVEKEIREGLVLKRKKLPQSDLSVTKMPVNYWDQLSDVATTERVFDAVNTSSNEIIQQECNELFHLIQKYIILDNTEEIINTAYMWIQPGSNIEETGQVQPQVLRFLVHLILFFQNLGVLLDEEKCGTLIESYIQFLSSSEETMPLVANYTASLNPRRQLIVYSEFLKSIEHKKSREEYLELAYEAGLDVPSITKRVVEEIREEGTSAEYSLKFDEPDTQNGISEILPNIDTQILHEDKRLINSIDWLVFDVSQRDEAVKQCCVLMRSFLTSSKFKAACEVFEKLPSDSINAIHREWNAKGSAPLPQEVENAIREYFCMKAYFSAHHKFKEWFVHYHNKKPQSNSELKKKTNQSNEFSENLLKKQRQIQHIDEVEIWNQTLNKLCDNVRDHVYNVLLFPDGGWLVDKNIDDNEKRRFELDLLRRMCIPTLCDLLITALKETKNRSDECLELCGIITSNEYKLFKLFSKNAGKRLLKRIEEVTMDSA